MTFEERRHKRWRLRVWACCNLTWHLLLTRAFPDRARWRGPMCPRCGAEATP